MTIEKSLERIADALEALDMTLNDGVGGGILAGDKTTGSKTTTKTEKAQTAAAKKKETAAKKKAEEAAAAKEEPPTEEAELDDLLGDDLAEDLTEPEVSIDDIRKVMKKILDSKDKGKRMALKEVFEGVGGKTISDVPEELYAELLEKVTAIHDG